MADADVGEVVKEVCGLLKDSGLPASYDERHDTCKVRDVRMTGDGSSIIIKNSKDTLFIVPSPSKPVKGIDLARGETVVSVPSKVGNLVLSVPSTGHKYLRVAIELDLDKDGTVDGGAYRTFS